MARRTRSFVNTSFFTPHGLLFVTLVCRVSIMNGMRSALFIEPVNVSGSTQQADLMEWTHPDGRM